MVISLPFQSEWTEISIQKHNILPYLLCQFVPVREIIQTSWRNQNQKDASLKQSFIKSSIITDFFQRNCETEEVN